MEVGLLCQSAILWPRELILLLLSSSARSKYWKILTRNRSADLKNASLVCWPLDHKEIVEECSDIFSFIYRCFTRNSAIRGHWLHQVRCSGLRCDRDVIPSARNSIEYCCLELSHPSDCWHTWIETPWESKGDESKGEFAGDECPWLQCLLWFVMYAHSMTEITGILYALWSNDCAHNPSNALFSVMIRWSTTFTRCR